MGKTCLCYKTSKLVPTSLVSTRQNCDLCLFQSPSESLSLDFPSVTVTAISSWNPNDQTLVFALWANENFHLCLVLCNLYCE